MKENSIKSKILAVILIGGFVGCGVLAWTKFEMEEPEIELDFASAYIGVSRTIPVTVKDKRSGLRKIAANILQKELTVRLYEAELGKGVFSQSIELLIEPDRLNLANGKALFQLSVTDFSWWGWMKGNRALVEKEIIIDTKPPEVQLLTTVHNIEQGGAGMAIYKTSEACESGVMVGDRYFKGFSGLFADAQIQTVFFALGHDQGSETTLFVKAADAAGNTVIRALPHYIRKKQFRKDSLNISTGFLNNNMPEFFNTIPRKPEMSMIDYFILINRDERIINEETFREIASRSEGVKHWRGEFIQLPLSAKKAGFADHREYYHNGTLVDKQTHLGIDLASTAQSPVPAANSGKVLFVGNIGIYGKTIVIDHGFGLLTTYSHLSGYQVVEGQLVAKGEQIANTGITGLAGGDHLHYGVMIQHTFVNPLEWWDKHWIKNNIMDKINLTAAGYPLKTAQTP